MKRKPSPAALTRRSLFRYGAAGSAFALAGHVTSAASPARSEAAEPAAVSAFELDEATIADLQKRMESGEETARSLAEKYLARIEALDRKGPELRAVLEINPDALAVAEKLDAERKAGKVRGPLHGIPILVKDNIGTARPHDDDGRLARARGLDPVRGRLRREEAARGGRGAPRQDEPLRVGELPLDALDVGLERPRRAVPQPLRPRPQSRPARARARAPPPRRISAPPPSAPRRTARSSRRRTTAALVGIKPTLGLVSRAGIIPISHSQDTRGPDGRTVADAAILLAAMAGVDPADAATKAPAGKARGRLHEASSTPAGSRARGSACPARASSGRAPPADRLVEAAIADMKRLGADDRRSGRHRDGGASSTSERARGAALRVQGGPERVPRDAARTRRVRTLADVDRVQREEPRPGDAVLRPGDLRAGRDEGAADRQGLPRGAREGPAASRARTASTRRWTSTSSTRSSRRPAARRR